MLAVVKFGEALCTCQFQAPPQGIPIGDLTLTLVPTPGAVYIDVENFPIFIAVAVKGIGSHSLLFEVAIAQYLAKMCCQIPY